MSLALLSMDGVLFLLRWIHFFAGVTWIGLLYYFNFVQVPYFAETKTGAGTGEFRKLIYRALFWFRWGAMFTFLSGITILALNVVQGGHAVLAQSWGIAILTGGLFGTIMFLNVWLVIWPKQQIVLKSADAVAGGGQADPAAGPAGARAFLASRTNTLFSIPMLFFMGAARHLPILDEGQNGWPAFAIIAVIAGAIEANMLVGKKGEGASKMLEKHATVIHVGIVLALVSYLLIELIG
jgi:uncharacterized membrane protein